MGKQPKKRNSGNTLGLCLMILAAVITIIIAFPVTDGIRKIIKDNIKYIAGTYSASEKGFGGKVKAIVTVGENGIEDISFEGAKETPDIGGAAVEKLNAQMKTALDTEIDSVSGATVTSTALKRALKKALLKAQGKEVKKYMEVKSADIVVIGAGGAGMSAAIEAAQKGATNVVILEKMPITGGNTVRATGGLNASETQYQKRDGIEDSNDLFYEDTMKGGKNLNDPELVRTLVENSAAAVDWVNEIGGDLSVVAQFGGASVKRIHRPSDTSAVGPMLVKTLNAKLDELGIPVLLETKATKIIADKDGNITGVEAEDENGEFVINTKAVILATGGFGANPDMVVKYAPQLAGFITTNHSGATGDGIEMALELGAGLTDIEQIQTHPTVNPNTATMYTEGVRGNGAILVNDEGNRFVNELETRDVVSASILAQPNEESWLVFDTAVRESLSAIEKYINEGIIVEANTIEELAEKTGINKENLVATMNKYASMQEAGEDSEFGRKSMEVPLTKAPFFAGLAKPAIHHTMGGVKINKETQVLKEDGSVIPGLYAAGEVVGGVHGGNRLGGNAVADIVVFGRISGDNANGYVLANGGNTERTIVVENEDANFVPQDIKTDLKDGSYKGVAKGFGGDVEVTFTVKDGIVNDLSLSGGKETAEIGGKAMEKIKRKMQSSGEFKVDSVAGASITSKGVSDAIKNATLQ
ncbi:MAG: flavocytochrome c [Lachnoanaerobaculum gingivalis]